MSLWHIIPLAILVPQYSWSSSKYYLWICVWHSTLLLRNTQLLEEHLFYIGLLSVSPILAINANGGEVSESFVQKSSESSPCFGFVPKLLHLIRMHYWLLPDTSILHHAFISIFIALWAVITHYVTILMPILSYL